MRPKFPTFVGKGYFRRTLPQRWCEYRFDTFNYLQNNTPRSLTSPATWPNKSLRGGKATPPFRFIAPFCKIFCFCSVAQTKIAIKLPKKIHTHTHTHTALIVGGRRQENIDLAVPSGSIIPNRTTCPYSLRLWSFPIVLFIRQIRYPRFFVCVCVCERLRAGNLSEGYHTRILRIRSKRWNPSADLSILEVNLLQFPIRNPGSRVSFPVLPWYYHVQVIPCVDSGRL